ncbi:MAG: hypothetical protein WCK26_00240 [Candidatus Saccharibacteria bacterium]
MGAGYTVFSFGPVIFFLICAISSVAWLTLAMSIAIKGIVIVPEKKSTFIKLFYVAAIFAAIFFFAVVKYEWLGGTTSYDGLYHSTGFIGSIIIGIVAISIRDNNKLRSFGVGLLPFFVAIGFLIVNATFTSGASGDLNSLSYVIGFFFASIQVIYPLAYYFYIKQPSNMQAAIDKRNAKIDKKNAKMGIANSNQMPSASTQPTYMPPTQTAATPQTQSEPLNATQDTTNRQ